MLVINKNVSTISLSNYCVIGTQCVFSSAGLPVPEYQLPFQEEIGTNPKFEDMQQLVCKNKQRPVFPDTWKDTNQVLYGGTTE